MRHRAFETDLFTQQVEGTADLFYRVDPSSIQVHDANASITAVLNLNTTDSGLLAQTLNLRLTFYQNGIMRTFIDEPGNTRFKISDSGLPVVEEQLDPVENLSANVTISTSEMVIDGLIHSDKTETFKYIVYFNHFKVEQYSNGQLTLVMNPNDSLYYESHYASTAHIKQLGAVTFLFVFFAARTVCPDLYALTVLFALLVLFACVQLESHTQGFSGLRKRAENCYGYDVFVDYP